MGQDTSTASAPPRVAELRREIEHTREELGDTVAALVEKADVKAHVKERVSEIDPRPFAATGVLLTGLVVWRALASRD